MCVSCVFSSRMSFIHKQDAKYPEIFQHILADCHKGTSVFPPLNCRQHQVSPATRLIYYHARSWSRVQRIAASCYRPVIFLLRLKCLLQADAHVQFKSNYQRIHINSARQRQE